MAKPSSATGLQTPSARSSGKAAASAGKRKKVFSASKLFDFDREFGRRYVAGADEAGRGSLAGPLVAAAVLFDYQRIGPGELRALMRLNDSKAHSLESREQLFPAVMSAAAQVSIISYSSTTIDEVGLHRTNIEALTQCLRGVAHPQGICLIDGFELPSLEFNSEALIDGDARSAAIAAASVVAKVSRDRFMHRADELYPGWDFVGNVGYSTAEHRAAIKLKGITPLHRLSFRSVAYQQLDLEPPERKAA